MMSLTSNKPGVSCLARALKFLARREYLTYELEQKLLSAGYTEDEVADAVAKLKAKKFLSDERAAEACARETIRKNKGFRHLAAKLSQKGSEIKNARALYPIEQEIEAIAVLVKRHRWSGDELRKRLFNRGFSYEAIERFLHAAHD